MFSFTLETWKGTQLSKQTSSKSIRTKRRGIQSGETKAVSPSFAITLTWKKNGQNMAMGQIHKLQLSDTKINVSHPWVTYRRNASKKQTC